MLAVEREGGINLPCVCVCVCRSKCWNFLRIFSCKTIVRSRCTAVCFITVAILIHTIFIHCHLTSPFSFIVRLAVRRHTSVLHRSSPKFRVRVRVGLATAVRVRVGFGFFLENFGFGFGSGWLPQFGFGSGSGFSFISSGRVESDFCANAHL